MSLPQVLQNLLHRLHHIRLLDPFEPWAKANVTLPRALTTTRAPAPTTVRRPSSQPCRRSVIEACVAVREHVAKGDDQISLGDACEEDRIDAAERHPRAHCAHTIWAEI